MNRLHCRWALTLVLVWVVLPLRLEAGSRFTEESARVRHVFRLMDERLSLMPDVAAWKWKQNVAVTNPKREQEVLDRAVKLAQPLGLESASVRNFFELQIELARALQEKLVRQWQRNGFDSARYTGDLSEELRPHLDRLTAELLRALYLAAPVFERADFVIVYESLSKQHLRALGWSNEARRDSLEALALIDVAPGPSLDRINASRVLRIGTTGDYAPFSLESAKQLSGLDIELGRSLARSLGVDPIFVRTSWPTLSKDLQQGSFDLAMSGISITPEREAIGEFSVPYHVGGKTIVTRCRDAWRFKSAAAVNQPHVRVIVNPGGTNEQYARQHLSKARIRIFPDNRGVFDEIRADRADVMVTDDVEVELQTRRHRDLCRPFKGTLTHAAKAIFMPRDKLFTAVVNRWLGQQIESEAVERLLHCFLRSLPEQACTARSFRE